jgi:hypothetical protein
VKNLDHIRLICIVKLHVMTIDQIIGNSKGSYSKTLTSHFDFLDAFLLSVCCHEFKEVFFSTYHEKNIIISGFYTAPCRKLEKGNLSWECAIFQCMSAHQTVEHHKTKTL